MARISLAHPFREQLVQFIDQLPDWKLDNPAGIETNAKKWSGINYLESFEQHKKLFTQRKQPLVERIQKFLGLVNVKRYSSDADLIFANGGFLITNRPYVTYLEKATQPFGYTAKNYKKPLGRWMLRNRLKDEHLKFVFFRTETALEGFKHTFKDDNVISDAIGKKGVWVYPPVYKHKTPSLSKFRNPKTVQFLFQSSSFFFKGGEQLVCAFIRLAAHHKNVRLVLITKRGTISDEYVTKIAECKQIKLVEANLSLPAVQRYYEASHCFVYPTYSDSFSMTINEAASYYLPVITSDFFSIPERIKDGKNGFLFKSPFPNYTKNYVISEEHFLDVDTMTEIVRNTESGKLKYVENFLYEKMKLIAMKKGLLYKLASGSKEVYDSRLSNERMLAKIRGYFSKAIQ